MKTNDVFVVRDAPGAAVTPLSTKLQRLPLSVGTFVDGRKIEGHIDVGLQRERMVFNPATQRYEGMMDVCFRSSASEKEALRLLPLTLRFRNSPSLTLGRRDVTLTNAGNLGCCSVEIGCPLSHDLEENIVFLSDSGDEVKKFAIAFVPVSFFERFKILVTVFGGILLGAFGGLVRTWHPPLVKNVWKAIVEGGFCGLILVLLGELGVKTIFQIHGPVTTGVILGLSGVAGYLGARIFERFAPKEAN